MLNEDLNNKTISISVIVPVYNVENYLEQCIDSILKQSFNDFELILINDGSTDSSLEICNKFSQNDSRIKVISIKNSGVVNARITGLQYALGKYVCLIDSDDWIAENYLSVMYNDMITHNVDLVCTAYVNAFENRKINIPLQLEPGYYNEIDIQRKIFPFLIEDKYGNYFTPSLWGKLFKKDLLMRCYCNFTNISVGEDGATVKPYVYNCKSIFMNNEYLYFYRQNLSSITKSKKVFKLDGPFLIAKHYENSIDTTKFDFEEQVCRNFVHNLFNVCISMFNENKKYLETKKNILKLLNATNTRKYVKNCKFSFKAIIHNIAYVSIKYRLVFILKICSNFK